MDFLSLAKERCSVRKFKPEPVRDEDIEKIIKAGSLAPTACNKQPQRVYVIKSAEGLAKLKKCTECHFDAPLAFIIGYNRDECWVRPFDSKNSGDIDASIVATHMMLAAADIGVGSTWVMYFVPEAVMTEFDLPEWFVPTAILPMGYPAEGAKPAKQHDIFRPEAEIIKYI